MLKKLLSSRAGLRYSQKINKYKKIMKYPAQQQENVRCLLKSCQSECVSERDKLRAQERAEGAGG